jgi:hemolysin activation/secretion protein
MSNYNKISIFSLCLFLQSIFLPYSYALDFIVSAKDNLKVQQETHIDKIEVKGSTILTQRQIDYLILNKIANRPLTEDLAKEIAQAITKVYIDRGYLTSRAIYKGALGGIAHIEVLEGGIENIVIEGTTKLTNYIRSRVEQATSRPLNISQLEEQLLLLKQDPRFESFKATIKPPVDNSSQSILLIQVKESKNWLANIGISNYLNSPSIGATTLNFSFGLLSLTSLGDSFTVTYNPAVANFSGTYLLDINYQVPINPQNGTIMVRTVINRSQVIEGEASALDITGSSELYQLHYRQPLFTHPNEEFALTFGFDYQSGQNLAFQGTVPIPTLGSTDNGEIKTSVFVFGQDYFKRDEQGIWLLSSQFNVGTYLFGANKNDAPLPDSAFFSWLAKVQRLQIIDPNNTLIISADFQIASKPLLTSQQFVIGGEYSVRGYRQNVIAGDNGIHFSIEDRISLARDEKNRTVFTIAPFLDVAGIKNNINNPTPIILNHTLLVGLGFGLIWDPTENWTMRLDYAPPLEYLNLRGNNIQDNGFYFSMNYKF